MLEISGQPLVDWVLRQAPVIVVLIVTSWRLERLVAHQMDWLRDELRDCIDVLTREK